MVASATVPGAPSFRLYPVTWTDDTDGAILGVIFRSSVQTRRGQASAAGDGDSRLSETHHITPQTGTDDDIAMSGRHELLVLSHWREPLAAM